MKSLRLLLAVALTFGFASTAWAQWSSDPLQNLALSDIMNADQVQPKVLALPDNSWWVSWFNANPNDPPPIGYDVYIQHLNANGFEQFPHDGLQVAKLTLSSTQDYGLDADASGNALIVYLDDRKDPNNPQITASKISPTGQLLWGGGIQLTYDGGFHADPKIAATSDGGIVVAWTTDNNVIVVKLDSNGRPFWGGALVSSTRRTFTESGYSYSLADMHAADNGSVILSWVRSHGFSGSKYLYANKLSASGDLLWGSSHVKVFDGGSLQFGEFPYFATDGNGGAIFSWYSSSPSLQVYAQHILANGTEAFPHNGSAGSTNGTNLRVSPTASYRAATNETFLFWTEEDSNQTFNGVYGQKFDAAGNRQWGNNGLTIVPLGSDSQLFVQNVQIGTGALVYWFDQPGFGTGTIQAQKLDGSGATICAQFGVSTASADKSRLSAGIASSGLSALAFEDDRNGWNDIYIQNVNPDCTLGIEGRAISKR
jgi:hypothetical protein